MSEGNVNSTKRNILPSFSTFLRFIYPSLSPATSISKMATTLNDVNSKENKRNDNKRSTNSKRRKSDPIKANENNKLINYGRWSDSEHALFVV